MPRGFSVDMTLREHVHSRSFDHSALLYRSEHEYVDSVMHFITEGLEQRQPVLVVVPGETGWPRCSPLWETTPTT